MEHQLNLQGSSDCFSIRRSYGNGPEVVASLSFEAALLPTFIIKRVPAQARHLRGSTPARMHQAHDSHRRREADHPGTAESQVRDLP